MLTTRDLDVRFGELRAVASVSLEVPPGRVLAVLGPSGCGKSSLLRAIAGLEHVAAGSVRYDGQDVAGLPPHRRGFALMFQDGQLFEHRDVAANVGYPLRIRRRPRREVADRVRDLLELVGLPDFGLRMPATLSGGERQRVALARALAASPRLLLLDEPLSSLDRALRDRLAGDLRDILVRAGTTTVLVTHDHEEAFATSDLMAVMRHGVIVQQGPLGEVWTRPVDAETALFLGYASVLGPDQAQVLLATVPGAPVLGPGDGLAVRRSALRVDAAGQLAGRVLAATVTPEQLRVRVDVERLGTMHAVAPLGSELPVGQQVGLALDAARVAVLPAG